MHLLPEFGLIALILALLVASLQALLPLIGAQRGLAPWMAVARPAAWAQLALVALAFAILTWAFVVQDFSVAYVAQNSNSLLPMLYRYSAVWGAHEGSLLLWALILALWTAAVAAFSRHLPEPVMARVLGTMGVISAGFLAFLIFTSNPFERVLPALEEGRDLNPLLQDPGLIFHPPMLYMGYVGFAVPFAFAIAALLDRNASSAEAIAGWLRWTRPWTNIAWAFLTLGIALGSWWAYYELGWGGWWFWDPVENASFMPWLAGAALLHSQAITEKRGSFRSWTLLLAIAAFSLSLLGTFLVRSGVLTSVHAFAADPGRGLFILIFLGTVIGASLLLYALRTDDRDPGQPFVGASREALLLINNVFLTAACAMVLLGTLWPLVLDAVGSEHKVSVGPPYFSVLFTVLMTPIVLLIPFGPLIRWQRDQFSRPLRLLLPWAALALVVAVIAYVQAPQGPLKTAAGVAGALWVGLGTARFVWQRLRTQGRLTAEMAGMALAHGGIAVFLVGALLVEAQMQQREIAMKPGQTLTLGRDSFRFDGVEKLAGPNYTAHRGTVEVFRDDRRVTTLHPEKREYASGGQVMTEAGIRPGVTRDLFVALGEPLGGGAWAVRVHIKPFIRWVWIGALLMALGALVTAADRRFRRTRADDHARALGRLRAPATTATAGGGAETIFESVHAGDLSASGGDGGSD
jgi:cytochrome c-type biogenesis protein CcmF